MRYVRVKVKRDTNTVHNRAVPEWEVPILEFIFEDGNVERTEIFEKVESDYPDAGVEFHRLTQRYGADPQNGVPYAAAVYGNAGVGVRALRKAIEAARAEEVEDEAKPAATHAPTGRAAKSRKAASVDSLLG